MNENRKLDVAIIGGGVIGVTTAIELAERGLKVGLYEKGAIACEQSSRNWGWVRKMGRDAREIPLMLESARIWSGMDKRIGAQTGFTKCGIAYLARNEKELAAHGAWLAKADGQRAGSRLIGKAELQKLLPELQGKFAGALYTADDARAEPFIAVPAMAAHARNIGVDIHEQCAVRGFETSAGRVSAVITEKGRVETQALVVAGGWWSRRFLGNHGISFPQLGVINSVMRTSAVAGPSITASGADFAYRRRADGGYTIAHNRYSLADITPDHLRQGLKFFRSWSDDSESFRLRFGKAFFAAGALARRWKLDEVSPFEKLRVLDPAPVASILDGAWKSLQEHLPLFRGARIEQRWAGMIDATPDAVPVIGPVPGNPGLYLASGFSGHGFGIGPGAGKLMADIITQTAPVVDPEPFRFNRF